MKNKVKEMSLIECLKWCDVAKLPEKDDGENIWIKAIALVQKADGSENYVAMMKDKDLKNKIVKDFGSVSIVKNVVEIYPYSYLLSAYMPEFKTKKKEERIAYLVKCNGGNAEELAELTLKELDKKVVNHAIKNQIVKEQVKK